MKATSWTTVWRLEWRILARDRAALVVLLCFSAVLVVAALAGGRQAAALHEAQASANAAESARDTARLQELAALVAKGAPPSGQDPRDPVWMGNEGATRLAVLPPGPLASIAVGQRDLLPQAMQVGTSVQHDMAALTETPMVSAARLATGPLDPAFLFVVLFPLVVVALSYSLLSGERERGTLAMLLSQPVSQGALVLGKAVARLALVGGVTVLFAVLGLAVAGAQWGADGAIALVAGYVAVLLAWAAFWFSAAVAVNATGGTSERNALALVGAWLALVVILPGLLQAGLDTVMPAPNRMELVHKQREAAAEIERELVGLQGRHDRDTKTKAFGQQLVATQERLIERLAPVQAAFDTQLAGRQAFVAATRYIVPTVGVQLAMEDLAGSSTSRQRRFSGQVATLQSALRGHWFGLAKAKKPATADAIGQAPRWRFVEEPLADVLGRVGATVAILLILSAALVTWARPRLQQIGRLAAR